VERLAGTPLPGLIRRLARAGVGIAQLRAKALADGELLGLACSAVEVARAEGVLLVINDRPDVARLSGADGVHLGQQDLPAAEARALLPEALIGTSTHDPEQLARAIREPVDYVAVGPVYATTSKRKPDPVAGLELVRAARAVSPVPVVAIGGIDRGRARAVIEAGADGLAVIGDLLGAPDLDAALAEYAALLSGAGV
jgi:thiamine-phosphate pyrophosphorylase